MTQAVTRSDRRRARTRGELIRAGRTLIGTKGVAGLKIQEITDEADVALGSFYNHFANKGELVEAVVEESLAGTAAAAGITEANQDQDPAVTVVLAIRRIVGVAFQDPDLARLLVHLDHADLVYARAMRPQATAVVLAGVESGRFRVPDVDVAVVNVVAGSLALIRRILDGEHGVEAVAVQAVLTLRLLGLDNVEAEAMARHGIV